MSLAVMTLGLVTMLRPISSATLLLSYKYIDIPKVPSKIPIEKALKSAPSIDSCSF